MNIKEELLTKHICIDNEYLNKYICLIENNRTNNYIKNKTQKHHIIPRNYYIKNNCIINNDDDNLVTLLYKDHILAHYYLALCSTDKYKYSHIFAFLSMSKEFDISDDEQSLIKSLDKYQQLYEDGKKLNSEFASIHLEGHTVTEETKQKIRDKAIGRYSGNIAIHKGNIDKHIPAEDLENYLTQGYELGRSDLYKQKLSLGYNYESKGMLGKHQSEKQRHISSEVNKHPRDISSINKQKQTLSNKTYICLRHPIKGNTIKIKPENLDKFLTQGYVLCNKSKTA